MTQCYSHRKKDPFVRFNKSIVYDNSISLKAKGLLLIAFSRPEGWVFYKHEMMQHCADGETSFDSGIKELETAGYLHRTTKHEIGTGKFQGWDWHFLEEAVSGEEFKKLYRNGGNPVDGETPSTGKPGTNKKDFLREKENNNKAEEVVVVPFLEKTDEEPPKKPPLSCLDTLPFEEAFREKIPHMKNAKGRNFTAKQIQKAVNITAKSKFECLPAFFTDALRNPKKYQIPCSPEEREKNNKQQVFEVYGEFDGNVFDGHQINILNKYVEIVVQGGNCSSKIFEYKNLTCMSDLEACIRERLPSLAFSLSLQTLKSILKK